MIKKLKNRIEFIGLEVKTEIIKMVIFFIIPVIFAVILYFFTKSWLFLLFGISLSFIILYLFLSSYKSKEENILKSRDFEFINVINYFQTFIANGNNVYQSFKKLINYSSDWMKETIQNFLSDVDADKSVKPFIDFAKNFRINFSENIMLSIFQMVDTGETNKQLIHFESLLKDVTRKSKEELKDKKNKTMGMYASFPVVGAAYITILLSISIISVMGELINVI